jgi:hypothetical protein
MFCTQTLVAGSLFGPSNARPKSGMYLPDELNWRQVGPGEELTFNFEDRGRSRQHNSQEIKINQIVAKIDGLQGNKIFSLLLLTVNIKNSFFPRNVSRVS